jgi:hypothetical protein
METENKVAVVRRFRRLDCCPNFPLFPYLHPIRHSAQIRWHRAIIYSSHNRISGRAKRTICSARCLACRCPQNRIGFVGSIRSPDSNPRWRVERWATATAVSYLCVFAPTVSLRGGTEHGATKPAPVVQLSSAQPHTTYRRKLSHCEAPTRRALSTAYRSRQMTAGRRSHREP